MKKAIGIAVGLALVLGITAFVVAWPRIAHIATVSESEISEFKATGESMIRKIEAFHLRHGRFPNSLREAEITPVDTEYGPWEYRSNGSFQLSLGRYEKHYFTLSWHSDEREWHFDH